MNYRVFFAVRKGAELLQCVYRVTRTKLAINDFVAIFCNLSYCILDLGDCTKLHQIANRLTKVADFVNRFITFVPQFGNVSYAENLKVVVVKDWRRRQIRNLTPVLRRARQGVSRQVGNPRRTEQVERRRIANYHTTPRNA